MRYDHAMKRFFDSATAVFIWTTIGVLTVFTFLAIAVSRCFDWNDRFTYRLGNLWGKLIVKINPWWKIKILGTHHIKNNKGYIIVANHMSLADIVCLFCIGKHFKWVAKASLFKIPFFGWSMSLLNYIPLSRGKHSSIRDSFNEAIEWLNKDVSVLIFPEGTRSKTGNLSDFKNGAFKLALLTKKPIVPVVITGTQAVLTKGRATMDTKASGTLKVLEPIEVTQYSESDFDELKDKVWKLMSQELNRSKN